MPVNTANIAGTGRCTWPLSSLSPHRSESAHTRTHIYTTTPIQKRIVAIGSHHIGARHHAHTWAHKHTQNKKVVQLAVIGASQHTHIQEKADALATSLSELYFGHVSLSWCARTSSTKRLIRCQRTLHSARNQVSGQRTREAHTTTHSIDAASKPANHTAGDEG